MGPNETVFCSFRPQGIDQEREGERRKEKKREEKRRKEKKRKEKGRGWDTGQRKVGLR